jgi:hypothetical protein
MTPRRGNASARRSCLQALEINGLLYSGNKNAKAAGWRVAPTQAAKRKSRPRKERGGKSKANSEKKKPGW